MSYTILDLVIIVVWTWGVCRLMLYGIPSTVSVKEWLVCSHLGSIVIVLLILGVFSAGSDAQTAMSFLLIAVPVLCLAEVLGRWQDAAEDQAAAEDALLPVALPLQKSEGANADDKATPPNSES